MAKVTQHKKVASPQIQQAQTGNNRVLYWIKNDGNVLEKIGERSYKYLASNTKEGDVLVLKDGQELPEGKYL